jgi:hypothetical protein
MAEKYIERKYVVLIYKLQTFDECKFKVSDSLIYININFFDVIIIIISLLLQNGFSEIITIVK